MRDERSNTVLYSVVGTLVALILIAGLALGMPRYNVWRLEMRGKAQLREAEWNRQIKVQEANAELEAAKALAQAEVERAKGVAESNAIVADGLGGPEGYLRYLWIKGLQDGSSEVIYVPTEAQLPILEATRGQR